MRGPKSDIHKQHMRENHADVTGKKNPMYGRSITDFMSEDEIKQWKQNISKSHIGRHFKLKKKRIPPSEETRQKMSIARKKSNMSRRWVTNGIDNKFILKSADIPVGYRLGYTQHKKSVEDQH